MRRAYLLRFDDICPTMNWDVWERVEKIIQNAGIRPILAVVPDNKHPALMVSSALTSFWEKVRQWKATGWTIGLHGYQHTELTANGGLLGINGWSEFAGLPADEQESRLRAGLDIMRRHDIEPDIWVAPGHSFDHVTIRSLSNLGLRTISDGSALFPFRDSEGVMWIPQQLWRLRRVPFGVWTVGLHVNHWTTSDVARFEEDVNRFRPRITDVGSVIEQHHLRNMTVADRLFATLHRTVLKRRQAWAESWMVRGSSSG